MVGAPEFPGRTIYELSTGRYPGGELSVVSLRGVEQVSKPFSFEILIFGAGIDGTSLERDLLGQRASLWMRGGSDEGRPVHGIIRRVEAEGISGGGEGRHRFRVWLAPRLWLLGRGRNTRIFQDLTVREIVAAVLAEAGVDHTFRLVGTYAPRKYCVQHQESDLAFVRRLLAEEGIFYAFEHPVDGDREVVIFCDDAHLCPPIAGAPELTFRDSGGMREQEDDVRRFRVRGSVMPGSTLLKEFDFLRPSLDLTAAAEAPAEPDAFHAADLRVYDHHGEFEGAAIDAAAAARNLEQLRGRGSVAEGESRCRRLVPGQQFTLAGDALTSLDGSYTVIRVEHEGHHPEAIRSGGEAREIYKNRFHCVPGDVAPRPKRPKRRIQQVMETATVTGPVGQEIHVDEHGRIKVQFHWDRQGRRDERSSCWIRTMQTWAGTGWGFQFIPRIGMEVMVMFLAGDTDRPMVIGCVPNAEHPPPFRLPHEKTRSGIRSHSSKGGDGYNEISFSDRKGYEELLFRAQKDMKEEILHDKRVRVGGTSVREVTGEDVAHVLGNQVNLVSGGVMVSVGGSHRTSVAGDDQLRVEGGLSVHVEQTSVSSVKGDARSLVEGSATAHVAGSDQLRVDGAREIAVRGSSREEVGGDATFVAGGTASVRVARGASVTATSFTLAAGDGSAEQRVTMDASAGNVQVRGAGTITLAADEALIFRVGKKVIRIDDDGIHLLADTTTIKGTSFVVETEKSKIASDEILLSGGQGELALKDTAKLKGTSVALGGAGSPPSRDSASSSSPSTHTVKVDLFDREGHRIDDAPYRVTMAGVRREGTASGGIVEIAAGPDVESVELEWSRPLASRPAGASRAEHEFRAEIFLAVDHEDEDEALRRKLHNLGIRAGSVDGMRETLRRWKGLDRPAEAGDVDTHLDGSTPILRKDG